MSRHARRRRRRRRPSKACAGSGVIIRPIARVIEPLAY